MNVSEREMPRVLNASVDEGIKERESESESEGPESDSTDASDHIASRCDAILFSLSLLADSR